MVSLVVAGILVPYSTSDRFDRHKASTPKRQVELSCKSTPILSQYRLHLQDNSTCLLAVVNTLEKDQRELALAIEKGSTTTRAALIEALGATEINFKLALKKGQNEVIDLT